MDFENYKLYCDVTQAKKALGLGAELTQLPYQNDDSDIVHTFMDNGVLYRLPTYEQMIEWIESRMEILFIDVFIKKSDFALGKWRYIVYDGWGDSISSDEYYFKREFATREAINAALDYLENNRE